VSVVIAALFSLCSFRAWHAIIFAKIRRWPVVPGLAIGILVFAAVFAPVITTHNPRLGNLRDQQIPPVWMEGGRSAHLLGTDNVGRDIFARIIYGSRVSLAVATTVLVFGCAIGTSLGLIAGYVGGQLDEILMRAVDFTLAVPFIMVALVTITVFGHSLTLLLILLILFSWGGFTRQARGETLSLKTRDYVALARIAGASGPRIIVRHILPGVFSTIVVVASLSVGGLILTESTLSFLGVGIQPPTPAWGLMVADGRNFLRSAWWISTFPGVAIFLTVFAVNFMGDWFRDYFDPRLREL